jgi:UDP:flavonoid glycosyltransferase YjiC (YdhE family)
MLALGSTGDILPYIALGKGLADAGCRVKFATFKLFEEKVVQGGMIFHPIPGDPRTLVAQGGGNIFSMARSFGSIADQYTAALSESHLLETDLIINQLPGGMFGCDLAEKSGVPMIQAAVIPLVPTDRFPMMGFPDVHLPGINRLTYTLAEIAAWRLFGSGINHWRMDQLGLPALSRKEYFRTDWRVINGFSPVVVERPPEWGDRVHITGYWFPEDPGWQPPAALKEFLDDGPPPVFIGFGSMPVQDPARLTGTILKALEQTDQRAILHTGWAGLGTSRLPDSVYALEYAPYDWLFPKMALVIHHGGSGTTGFGLRAGVPSCAIGLGFDQIFWGKRIAALGAGPDPIHLKKLTSERLVKVIQQGVYNENMRNHAMQIGRSLRKEQGISKAVQTIIGL